MFKTSFYNLALRGLTLGSKFILMLFIARYLTPEELGIYGLVAVTIGIAIYFLGMDFYVFNTREILAKETVDQTVFIRDQLAFHAVVYVFVLPLLLVVFMAGFISWKYVGWFYLLLVLEHLSQEAHRLFLTLSRPIVANVILFLRSGAWVYAVIAMAFVEPETRSLAFIWSGWIVGVSASLIVSVYYLRAMDWRQCLTTPVNWPWIKSGVRNSLIFFSATISMVSVQFVDRFFIQHYLGEAMVGVYTFYANIANVVQTFVFTGIIAILYPKIVSAYQDGRMEEYRVHMRKMGFGAVGGALLLSACAAIGIAPILHIVNKPIYGDYLPVFWIMLASITTMVIGSIPYYGLFVRRGDRYILTSTIIAVAVTLSLNFILVPVYGIRGAAFSSLSGFIILVSLQFRFLNLKKAKARTH